MPGKTNPKQRRARLRLQFEQRMVIAEEYRARMREASLAAHAREPDPSELAADLAAIEAVPASIRDAVVRLAISGEELPDSTSDDMLDAVEALRNRARNLNGGRIVRVPRAMNLRRRLLRDIAMWASRRYRTRVSTRMVRDCLASQHRFVGDLRGDDD
jgi:hypothetical protein